MPGRASGREADVGRAPCTFCSPHPSEYRLGITSDGYTYSFGTCRSMCRDLDATWLALSCPEAP